MAEEGFLGGYLLVSLYHYRTLLSLTLCTILIFCKLLGLVTQPWKSPVSKIKKVHNIARLNVWQLIVPKEATHSTVLKLGDGSIAIIVCDRCNYSKLPLWNKSKQVRMVSSRTDQSSFKHRRMDTSHQTPQSTQLRSPYPHSKTSTTIPHVSSSTSTYLLDTTIPFFSSLPPPLLIIIPTSSHVAPPPPQPPTALVSHTATKFRNLRSSSMSISTTPYPTPPHLSPPLPSPNPEYLIHTAEDPNMQLGDRAWTAYLDLGSYVVGYPGNFCAAESS